MLKDIFYYINNKKIMTQNGFQDTAQDDFDQTSSQ